MPRKRLMTMRRERSKSPSLEMPEENVPVAHPVDENDDRTAQHKNAQAWNALRKFGQPIFISYTVGNLVTSINLMKFENELFAPALTWPLVGLAIAGIVNVAEDDFSVALRNYVYYGLIGVLAGCATIEAPYTQLFFKHLNNGWLKDVFTCTLLHPTHGLGLCTMVMFHTLYLFLQKRIFKFAFKTF